MDLLRKAIAHPRFGSQRAVASFLGISEPQMSRLLKPYSEGGRNLQPIQAARLAEAIGENWLEQVLPILSGLEPSEEDKKYWLGKAARLARIGGVSLALLIAANVKDLRTETLHYSSSQVIDNKGVIVIVGHVILLISKWLFGRALSFGRFPTNGRCFGAFQDRMAAFAQVSL